MRNQTKTVRISVAASNVAKELRKMIENKLNQVDIKFAQLKRRIGDPLSSLGTMTLYETVANLNAEAAKLAQAVQHLDVEKEVCVKRPWTRP